MRLPGFLIGCRLLLMMAPGLAAAPPDHTDVVYGPHGRNRLDLWRPAGAPGGKAPLVVYLHGGGYRAGDKSAVLRAGILDAAGKAGVAVASANYRFRPAPIQDILRDCGRAVQFLRTHAEAYGIDPERIALYGGSAGATASLWLAFHDDLRDPAADDPVLRASSKPAAVVAVDCQYSLDIPSWREVFGDSVRLLERESQAAGLFYGMTEEEARLSPRGIAVRRDCHLPAWIDARDPPVFLSTRTAGGPPRDYNQLVHHPRHVRLLFEACQKAGVRVIASAPGEHLGPAAGEPADPLRFLADVLLRP